MKSNLKDANLKHKRVLLRADLNVPRRTDGTIENDLRIEALVPTIDLIKEKGGKIVLLTHCGRPKKQEKRLSTKVLGTWLRERGYKTAFADSTRKAEELSKKNNDDIVILENLRFFKEEELNNEDFAKRLSRLGDYYVNDAFAVLHRNHTSVTKLAELFKPKDRTIGLLVEKELEELTKVLEHTKSPFVVLQGGTKGDTKLKLLEAQLEKVDTILISTPLCFSFLKAQNKNVGSSFVEDELIPEIKNFMRAAKKNNVEVVLPIDYQVSSKSFKDPLQLRETKTLSKGDIGISIGPKTAELFSEYLIRAKTVLANGLPGNSLYPETLEGTRIILHTLRKTNGLHVIAGGDSIALVEHLGFNDVGYLSTGGGATLAYLSGQSLTGLTIFSD